MQVKVNAGGDLGAGAGRLDSTTGAFFTVDYAFEYVDACGIDSVTPSSGQYKTAIDIAGSGLLGGGDSIDSITLADVDVLSIASESDSLIQVVADMSGAATGDIIITANTGAVTTRVDGWGYVAVGAISGASPNSGQVGTEVTIGGPGPMNGGKTIASVLLGGTEVCQIVSYYDAAVEVVVAAADASEDSDIVMYADTDAAISQAGGWTYNEEGEISSVDPGNGQGGTLVQIDGERLRGGGGAVVTVTLAGVEAELLTETDTKVEVQAAIGDAAAGHIVLTSDSGALVTLENGWTYSEAGVVDSISPACGQLNTKVTIFGSALRGSGGEVVKVLLSGVEATILEEDDDSIVVRADSSAGASGTVVRIESDSVAIIEDTGGSTDPKTLLQTFRLPTVN